MSDSRSTTIPPSNKSNGALRPLGFVVAIALAGLAFIPESTWTNLFQHPIRVERLGDIPETTIKGIRLLRFLLVIAAATWFLQPFILRGLERRLPLHPHPSEPRGGSWVLVILGIVTLAGIVLRAFRLQESLWYDEIAAMIASSLHGPGPAIGNYQALANHALHSALAAISLQAFGNSDAEIALRLPAFLAGVCCIPAMFALGRAVAGDRLGLIAAGVVAFMPVAVLESAEARGYSMMMLFATLSTLAWLRIGDGRTSAIPLYAALVALGCWSHLVFACVPIGHAIQGGIRLFRHQGDKAVAGRRGMALVLGGVSTLALIAPLLPDLLQRRTEFVALDGDEPSLFGIEGWKAFLQLGGTWTGWASIPGLMLLVFGILEAWRWPRLRLSAHAGLAGGLVALVIVIGGDSWIYARFLVFLLVPAALLQAAAIEGTILMLRRTAPAVITSVMILAAWVMCLVSMPPKQPIREGVELARRLAGTENAIWSIGLGDDVAMFYTEGQGPRLVHAPRLGSRLGEDELAVGPGVALVLYPDLMKAETRSRLERAGFSVAGRFDGWLDWGQGDVVVLHRGD